MLAPVLDPLDGNLGESGRHRHQRHVRVHARLDPEAPPDVPRHDEAELVLGHPEHAGREGMHDERPHEVRPDRVGALERAEGRHHSVGLDGGRAVLGIAKALADHDLRLRERAVGVAVDEPAVPRQVGPDGLVEHGRVGLEGALDVHHGGERLVADDHGLRRVLGEVPVARHHHRHRFPDEARLVGGQRVVGRGSGDADGEGLGQPRHVLARDHPDHALHGEGRRHLVTQDARMRVWRAHDGRVVDVGARGEIVDEVAAAAQQPRILDALHGLPDPAPRGHGPLSAPCTSAAASRGTT